MDKKIITHEHIEPRITALEIGQANLHRDVTALASAVKEQGQQLTSSLTKLAESNNGSYQSLLEKFNNNNKTDWSQFWTMITAILLLLTAISTPVWITFTSIDKTISKQESALTELKEYTLDSIQDRAEIRAAMDKNDYIIQKLDSKIFK
jgi:hypothetical protein